MAAHAVAGGKMTDEQLGALTRRVDELKRQLNQGSLSYFLTMRELQKIIDRKQLMEVEPWIRKVTIHDMGECLSELNKCYIIEKWVENRLQDAYKQALRIFYPFDIYTVDFVRITPYELGFPSSDDLKYENVVERALELNITLLPFHLGLFLAMEAKSLILPGERLIVASEVLEADGGMMNILVLGNAMDDGLYLDMCDVRRERLASNIPLVFRSKK